MRVVIKKKVDRDFMGGKTTVTKIIIDEADGSDLMRLLSDAPQGASRRLGAPLTTDAIEVSECDAGSGTQGFPVTFAGRSASRDARRGVPRDGASSA